MAPQRVGTKEEGVIRWNPSGGLVLDTFVGPFFVGGSVSLNSGDARFYLNLGSFNR